MFFHEGDKMIEGAPKGSGKGTDFFLLREAFLFPLKVFVPY